MKEPIILAIISNNSKLRPQKTQACPSSNDTPSRILKMSTKKSVDF